MRAAPCHLVVFCRPPRHGPTQRPTRPVAPERAWLRSRIRSRPSPNRSRGGSRRRHRRWWTRHPPPATPDLRRQSAPRQSTQPFEGHDSSMTHLRQGCGGRRFGLSSSVARSQPPRSAAAAYVARPETTAADLLRIGLNYHPVGTRGASREPCAGQVEGPPKEVHRADLADEIRPELPNDPVGLYQLLPEQVRRLWIIRGMPAIV